MKIRKILSLAVATCAVCAMDAMARPAFHGVIPVEQPDGSIVNVRKVGDEISTMPKRKIASWS